MGVQFVAVTLWWEGASIHRLVNISEWYSSKPTSVYYASGLAYGGENGDSSWERGRPDAVATAAGDLAYALYDQAVPDERRLELAREVARTTSRLHVTVQGSSRSLVEWYRLPTLVEELEERLGIGEGEE